MFYKICLFVSNLILILKEFAAMNRDSITAKYIIVIVNVEMLDVK